MGVPPPAERASQPPPAEAATHTEPFLAQLRIAGHLRDERDNRRAIYLDSIYVNRAAAEAAVLGQAWDFAGGAGGKGRWVSVVGDAGHGKSCLLWYLCHRLKEDGRFDVLAFLADRMADSLGRESVQAARRHVERAGGGRRVVVLIDTLDILVGVNDAALAETISALRDLGCLVVTTSRPQEADRFYQSCDRDFQVPLRRYTDEEFRLITRRYIEQSYPGWSEEQKARQFEKVTQLLEQQRDIARELDLEPLILRMIFEAYVPEDIPQDINTQKVYEKFWEQRVLQDRKAGAAVRAARARMCRLLAREIAFGGGSFHGEAVSLERLAEVAGPARGALPPEEVIEGLASTGVLQWSMGRQAVRFFHQTFFEYTAAYDLLCLVAEGRGDAEVAALLEDAAGSRFFRVPILKQLAVQDYYHGSRRTYLKILRSLRGVNSELAAQLTLEIAGKVEDPRDCVETCREWAAADGGKIGAVICETVRHYPSRHVGTALALLRPYLDTPRRNAVYALCAESFAIVAPDEVGAFLRARLDHIKSSGDLNEKNVYKDALLAAWYYGAAGAMRDLAALSGKLTDGQLVSLLEEMERKTDGRNAGQVAGFLSDVVLPAALARRCEAKVWDPIVRLFLKVSEHAPERMRRVAGELLEAGRWRAAAPSAVNVGKIVGRLLADRAVIGRALRDLSAGDHALRLMSAETLRWAGPAHSDYIIGEVLRIRPGGDEPQAYVDSLFRVVASLENADPAKILTFLERWGWGHGTGAALRETFTRLAQDSPAQSKAWLLPRLEAADPALLRTYFIFLGILAEADAGLFRAQDWAAILDIAFRSSSEVVRLLANLAGRIAVADEELADRLIAAIFAGHKEEQHTAVIMSLEYCAETRPEFVLGQMGRIFDAALATNRIRYFQALFRVLKSFGRGPCELLLRRLDELFTERVAAVVDDGDALAELIVVLKICARSNPRLAYQISTRCRVSTSGVAKGLSALYANIADRSDDPTLLREVLAGFVPVLEKGVYGSIVGNALGTALPRLDEKLGGRDVVETIFAARPRITNENTLVDLLNAAVRVPSFTQRDVAAMLNEIDPGFSRARGVLLVKRPPR